MHNVAARLKTWFRVPKASLTDDHGSVTAEFAIVLPAVLVVLGLVIGGVMLSAHRVALVSAAADLARLEARGDAASAAARIADLGGATTIDRSQRGPLHCVALRSNPGTGVLSHLTISAEACAAISDAAKSDAARGPR